MISKNSTKHINILNVNYGLLKADELGYFVEIPIYPIYTTKRVLNDLRIANAPQEFYDNLLNTSNDKGHLKYYISRILDEEVELTKEQLLLIMEMNGFESNNYKEFYLYLKENELKDTIQFMTSKNDDRIPFPMFYKKFN